jgi:hypothetical protein
VPGYRTWATNDVPSAADWNELHADPLQQEVNTNEASTATGYGALTTAGPSVTKTLVVGQKVLVIVSCWMGTVADGDGYMSFAVTGGTSLAAADANACILDPGAGVNMGAVAVSRTTVFTAGGSGSHTFTAQYKTNGNSMSFQRRRIVIKSF